MPQQLHLVSRNISNAAKLCREDSRVTLAFVNALNAFMLRNGLDIVSKAVDIQRALQPFVLRCWKITRDAKLKESLVLLLHIQLQLGAVQVSFLFAFSCLSFVCHAIEHKSGLLL